MQDAGKKSPVSLALVLAYAVLAAANASVDLQNGLEVRGLVLDSVNGKPVSDVRVTLIRRDIGGQQILNVATVTDDSGAFLLLAPSVGEYSLSVSKAPYSFGEYGRNPLTRSVPQWFRVSGPTSGLVVRLWHGPKISGKVIDEHGQGLAGASIHVMYPAVLGTARVLKTRMQGITDARGEYAIQLITSGEYFIAAFPASPSGGPARSPQYYPGVRTADAASAVVLAASESRTDVDFRLNSEPGFLISGFVDLPGDLVGTNSMELHRAPVEGPLSDRPVLTTTISRDGSYTFPRVAAGSYEIRFVKYPPPPANAGAPLRFNHGRVPIGPLAPVSDAPTWWFAERVDLIDRDVVVPLKPQAGVRVSGRLVFEGDGTAPNPALFRSRGVYLRALDHRFFAPAQLGPVNEDGSFRTVAVPPGSYVLGMFDSFDGFQLQSVRVGGKEVSGIGFNLDADVDNAVLTFSRQRTTVTGRLLGDTTQTKSVLIWPADQALWTANGSQLGRTYSAVSTDGSYAVQVFPGEYRVVGLTDVSPSNWEQASYLKLLLPFSQVVTVKAGSSATHDPRVVEAPKSR